MTLTALDLFCGAGGLTRGLLDAGVQVAGAVDSWPIAVESYRRNFPGHSAVVADVSTLDGETISRLGLPSTVDIVAGGPPCQGFSIQRIGADEDHRNDLVLAFSRAVLALRAKAFIMENVPGLLGARGRPTFVRFAKILSDAGYVVKHAILDAADFGVPQVRRRVFCVGLRQDTGVNFTFPEGRRGPQSTVLDAIGNLHEPPEDFTPASDDPLHRRMRISELNLRRLAHIPPGGGFEDLPVELRVDCHKGGASKIGHRAVYGRLHPHKPAGTITARFDSFTRGRFAHPLQNRNITLREGARLQGFPDSHVFLGTQEEIAAQIGNAIPPLLATAVCDAVRQALEGRGRARVAQPELPLAAGLMSTAA